ATGTAWDQILEQRVLRPFGMENAGFGWPSAQGDPWGHVIDGEDLSSCSPDDVFEVPFWLIPAGHLHASANDMGYFMQQYLKAYATAEHLSKHQVEHLFEPGIESALGWGVQEFGQHKRVAVYEGSLETFVAVIAIFPDADHGIFVVANSADPQSRQGLLEMIFALAPPASPRE
ncbi:MAG: serine hydrolase domain-containing protein, partial [Pseudomonadota bacterium]